MKLKSGSPNQYSNLAEQCARSAHPGLEAAVVHGILCSKNWSAHWVNCSRQRGPGKAHARRGLPLWLKEAFEPHHPRVPCRCSG
jgi:hypothetical protein